MIKNVKQKHDKISKKGKSYTSNSNLVFETFENGARNINNLSVKQLLKQYEGWSYKKNFMDSLDCYDGRWAYKVSYEEKRVIPRNAGSIFESYFGNIVNNSGITLFDIFDDKIYETKVALFSDPGYSTIDALNDLLEVWNTKRVIIAGDVYTPFEVYVAAWRWFQTYAPYEEGTGRMNIDDFFKPLSAENLRICEQNIVFHCAKWVQGYMAECVTIDLIHTIAQKNPQFNEKIVEVRDESEQRFGVDLMIGNDKVSIKSGQTLTTDIFKELPTDYTVGPLYHDSSGEEDAHMLLSYGKKGVKVSHKGFVFEGFIYYNLRTGKKRCMVTFIKERTGQV